MKAFEINMYDFVASETIAGNSYADN